MVGAVPRRERERGRRHVALARGGLAQLAALRATHAVESELRTVFLAWLEAAEEGSARELAPECDLRDRVAADPQALVFLERLIHHWSECL